MSKIFDNDKLYQCETIELEKHAQSTNVSLKTLENYYKTINDLIKQQRIDDNESGINLLLCYNSNLSINPNLIFFIFFCDV